MYGLRILAVYTARRFKEEELLKEEVTFNPNDSSNEEIVIINPNAKNQPILYNLDAIISVGYRVNSKQAIYFRKWDNKIIKDYIIKGFVLDEESLKNNASNFDLLLSEVKKSEYFR